MKKIVSVAEVDGEGLDRWWDKHDLADPLYEMEAKMKEALADPHDMADFTLALLDKIRDEHKAGRKKGVK